MKSPAKLIGLLMASVLYVTGLSVFAQSKNFPAYTGHVNDFANIIDPATKQQLETILLNFENKTGAQIAVVTIQSLNDRSIEDYAIDLFRAWGIGAKSGENRDKGALLLVSLQDRKMRLETGYGLEADLPDGMAGEILRRMKPYFRQEPPQYSQGIMVAVRTLVDTLATKWNVSLEGIEDRRFAYQGNQPPDIGAKGVLILVFAIFAIVLLFIFSIMMYLRRSTRGAATVRRSGSGIADAAWMLAPLIFNQGGGGFGGGGSSSGGGWGSGDSGGSSWGGFGGGESGGGGASDSW
jgi:uncharacterized protein